ncbi:protein of unknown function [Candidatus Filomicrobium marinum]|uniref:Uncharacterized protein n=1 Tax=Candidatus Filomicrobium marinum TaxID=1608628 RepID=A0A0D6JKF4_9HYPH|nr:protein of unknown function [Candidatus Filomicrobium marinum]CPR22443.1 protein of unknown function [Candidatus Filomicrobium marinum]
MITPDAPPNCLSGDIFEATNRARVVRVCNFATAETELGSGPVDLAPLSEQGEYAFCASELNRDRRLWRSFA